MHRLFLLDMLERYGARYRDEFERVTAFTRFVRDHPDCFLRSCRPGHVTGSAWIVDRSGQHCLLLAHRKLGRWLQPGGHCDGEPEPHCTAVREAIEETGLWDLQFAHARDEMTPLDIDVHEIPAYGSEPSHLHYDVRFLLVAHELRDPPASLRHEVRWIEVGRVATLTSEESVLRLARKAGTALAPVGRG